MIYLNNQTTLAVPEIQKNHFGLKGIKIKIFAHIAQWSEARTTLSEETFARRNFREWKICVFSFGLPIVIIIDTNRENTADAFAYLLY